MPQRLKKPCNHVGCSELTLERYCPAHKKQHQQQQDKERGSAYQRGYNARWQKYRTWYIKKHPLCCECEKVGRITPTFAIDHIVPHKGDYALFWDRKNHRPLCKRCHDRATVLYDGGFGNEIKPKEV